MAKMQQRRDTEANWTAVNPILANGEIGVNTQTLGFKVGDGVTTWALLPYAQASEGTGPVATAFSASILLDKLQGRDVALSTLGANTTFTVAPSPAPVNNGYLQMLLTGNGTAAATFTGWTLADTAYAWDASAAVINDLLFYRRGATNLLLGRTYASGATPAPVFSAQSAPAGVVGTAYSYTFAASNTTSFAVFSGTLPAGLSLNTATGALTGTPTTVATSAFVISATGGGGTTNSTAQSVAIAAAAAPGAATLAAGTATSTTQPLTITAPVSGGAPTSYAVFFKRAIDPTYSAGPVGASLTPTVTGLTASTSYNFKVVASNSGGSGPDSNVVTNSTAAAGAGSLTYQVVTPVVDENLTTPTVYDDYIVFHTQANGALDAKRLASPTISGFTLTNCARVEGPQGTPRTTYEDAASGYLAPSSSSLGYAQFVPTVAGQVAYIDVFVPASAVQHLSKIHTLTYLGESAEAGQFKVTASLTDGSAAPQVVALAGSVAAFQYTRVYNKGVFTHTAGSTTTVRLRFEIGANAVANQEFGIGYLTSDT